jgi:hypothetical protein
MIPLALVDFHNWKTVVTYLDGTTNTWAGRCTNIASLPIGKPGSNLRSVASRRVPLPVNANKPTQTMSESSSPKPVRRYTVHFDGGTKPATLEADTVSRPTGSTPGEFQFTLKGKLVALHRYVCIIEAEDIPPTVEELQAEIAKLKGVLGVSVQQEIKYRMLYDISQRAQQAAVDDYSDMVATLKDVQGIARRKTDAKNTPTKALQEIAALVTKELGE